MKILITGAGGLIGGYLAKAFSEDGHEVIATYRNTVPKALCELEAVRLIEWDLAKGPVKLDAVDIIIHAAAHTHLIPNSTASDYIHSNVTGMLHLADCAKTIRPRLFIYLSTLSVYGDIKVSELTEDTPLNHPEMYGLSKYMGELMLKECVEFFPSIVVRLPGVVGKGYFTPWLGKTLLKVMQNNLITIYNPASLFNNVVDLQELHRFSSLMMKSAFSGFDTFNLATTCPIKVQEVIDFMISLTDSKSAVVEEKASKQSFVVNTKKVEKALRFEAVGTQDIIRRYVMENASCESIAR